jgi:hypothetical protein
MASGHAVSLLRQAALTYISSPAPFRHVFKLPVSAPQGNTIKKQHWIGL